MQWELPEPDQTARVHSEMLTDQIRARIREESGWITFAEYMNLALYAPGMGYYSAGSTKFGESGDFITAPEISPLFSQCVAGQIAGVLQDIGGGVVLEPGAGRGVMAVDMLREFERVGRLPEQYLILEPSAELRARQKELVQQRVPGLAARVVWLDASPPEPVRGVVVANEVVDALPVQRFAIKNGVVYELGVGLSGEELVSQVRLASADFNSGVIDAIGEPSDYPDGYMSELNPRLPAWIASVGDWLQEGVALIFDYGYSRREYYMPERYSGTLRCYYRHRAHEDPFIWPGLQDITAWVDFTWLADSAARSGFEVAGYTTQAQFLLAAGLDELIAAQSNSDPRQQVTMAAGLRKLLMPGEMGDTIKVMALSKGAVQVPGAMLGRDMRTAL